MTILTWTPDARLSKKEELLMKRLRRTKKLFGFLREYRLQIFDGAFQEELASMYRGTGAGKVAVAPALMAMATLLQGYVGASDAEAVELTVVDLRWQMVLDVLGAEEPAFSQGTFHDFRHRLIRSDLDRRLLERTAEVALSTKAFDAKKLPKTLRVAIDSAPLEGAGRVEDTINLLAHAARQVLECVASLLRSSSERVARQARTPLLVASSVKRALDVDWTSAGAKKEALQLLLEELDRLEAWVAARLPNEVTEPPLREHLATLRQIRGQDLEPDPSGGSRIRKGVAEERRISIQDKDMRHGRKSKSKRIDGYKRHIALDLDLDLIVACAVTPANRPECEAANDLQVDLRRRPTRTKLSELFIDRGYVKAPLVDEVRREGGGVFCKPWRFQNGACFSKADFRIDVRRRLITCPAGQRQSFTLGTVVEFDPKACAECDLRSQCIKSKAQRGRFVQIAADEPLQHDLRQLVASPEGRERLRERVAVEHRLAHLIRKQGHRARYRGKRTNLFDVRRVASIVNLEVVHRALAA
jgi:hypothetical protein